MTRSFSFVIVQKLCKVKRTTMSRDRFQLISTYIKIGEPTNEINYQEYEIYLG